MIRRAMLKSSGLALAALALPLAGAWAADAPKTPTEITIYSGRSKNLVGPIMEAFEKETGIKVNARYGGTSELAATLLEEGKNSPADIFFAQDAGALGAIMAEGLFRKLPDSILNQVPKKFRSDKGMWVGTSGRARVVAYSTIRVKESDLPASVLSFTDPKWKGRLGWAPSNGSFQAFITAMRVKLGQDAARNWLKGIIKNEPKVYPNNSAIVGAIGAGEIDAGFVNHYYLLNFLKEKGPDFPVKNYYPKGHDLGAMLNVAGVGILNTAKNPTGAEKFINYLLDAKVQKTFVLGEDREYPMAAGVEIDPQQKPLNEIETPDIDLSSIGDLKGTLALLQEVGALE